MARYRAANPYYWLGQPATAQNTAPTTAGLVVPTGQGAEVYGYKLSNRTAGNVNCALVGLLEDSKWGAGQVTTAGVYTADTTDAQDVGADDFQLQNKDEAGSGHLISCDVPFGAIGYDISTASVGAAIENVIEYWNGAWTAIAAAGMLKDIPRAAGVQWTANEFLVLFDPPGDWAVGGTGVNVPATRYNLRMRATVAGTTSGLAKRIYLGTIIDSWGTVATMTDKEQNFVAKVPLPSGVIALGSAWSVKDSKNALAITY